MTGEVPEYYNAFLRERMVDYRLRENIRITAAQRLVVPLVRDGMTVADIGCGIGLVSEAIAKAHPGARVIGFDLSPGNIEYARRTVGAANVTFLSSSITQQFGALEEVAGGPIDLVCMIDVIEHIPEAERPRLFHDLARVMSDDATLVLTYPTPEYQRHRKATGGEAVQIIDEVIETADFVAETAAAGWKLESFRHVGIWVENEYVYAVLKKRIADDFRPVHRSVADRLWRQGRDLLLRPWRRGKYLVEPFRDWPIG